MEGNLNTTPVPDIWTSLGGAGLKDLIPLLTICRMGLFLARVCMPSQWPRFFRMALSEKLLLVLSAWRITWGREKIKDKARIMNSILSPCAVAHHQQVSITLSKLTYYSQYCAWHFSPRYGYLYIPMSTVALMSLMSLMSLMPLMLIPLMSITT